MEIAVIIEGRYPVFGGGQSHVAHLLHHFCVNYGYSIDLFTRDLYLPKGVRGPENNAGQLTNQVRHVKIGPHSTYKSWLARVSWIIIATWVLYKNARHHKYDLIHAHALLAGIPAKIVGWIMGIPVVYTVHGTMHLDRGKKGILYLIEKWLVCGISYDAEISVSKKILNYTNCNKNIHIIYNGVDAETFATYQVSAAKHHGVNFLYVGRIDWQKNLKWFAQALVQIGHETLKSYGFHRNIVGDGPLRQELLDYITQEGLADLITWKGPLFGGDLIKEYVSNHVFVLPSLAEGQPLTLLEAMASGLAILATDVGDNAHIIQPGINGYLVSLDNMQEFLEKIQLLLTDETQRTRMGAINKSLAHLYDRAGVVEQTNDVYLSVL